MMSTGRKSIAFMNSTQTNTVSASGATVLQLAVEDALDLLVDEIDGQLDERLRFDGTPRGRLARDAATGSRTRRCRGTATSTTVSS